MVELYKNKEYLIQEWVLNKKSQNKIAQENGVPTSRIEYWVKKHNIVRMRHKSLSNIESEKFNLDDPLYAYMIGFIASDGCLIPNASSVFIVIGQVDAYLLELFVEYFKIPCKVRYYLSKSSFKKTPSEVCSLRFNSKTLYNDCLNAGLLPSTKTFTLKFPKGNYSDTFYKYYLRGMFDGDANVRSTRKFRILSASEGYLDDVILFLNNKFNFQKPLTLLKQKRKLNDGSCKYYPLLEVGADRGQEILNWIYSDNYEIGLKRKIDKALGLSK